MAVSRKVKKVYPKWLREAAAKGGRKSRRVLTTAQARRMARKSAERRRKGA